MSKIFLNKTIAMDEKKFISTMTLLQASTGGGKSWAIRRILEQSFGKVPHIILDTEGEFATLREKYDYILIGKDYDIAADPKTAKLMALRLWEEGVSAIIDLYELSPWDRQLFVKNFVDAMVNAPKKLWNPVLLVIDEAHEYAPEGDRTESGRALHLLASKGRKREIGVIFATQRIASLSKNVVAACKNKLIGYTSLDIDMKRANAELGFTSKEQAHMLRKLDPGEFYGFGPAISREIIRFQIGDIKTSHGNHGSKAAKVAPASEKVKKALARLADLPQEAKQEATTIAELKAEIVTLKRQKETKSEDSLPIAIGVSQWMQYGEKNGYADFFRTKISQEAGIQWEKVVKNWEKLTLKLLNIMSSANKEAFGYELPRKIPDGWMTPSNLEPAGKVNVYKNEYKHIPADKVLIPKDLQNKAAKVFDMPELGTLTGPERKLISSLAWCESIGNDRPPQELVAFLSGYSHHRSTGYTNPRGYLKSKGLIDYSGGLIFLTDEGRKVAEAPEMVLTQDALQEAVLARLDGPEKKVLIPLLEVYPEGMSNTDLCAAAGYAHERSTGYTNPRGKLKSFGLIEYGQGVVKAKPLLFID